eukprot:TRINITY_DN13373_c0_g1_i1.p1 TRINITY_DN13373_c0_g1~~TRINITY_DN13373_c0_g1_i1.p1  ORF type:complete len:403 (+),score=62.24 TRINITY_DN13373_c0_g1_i1:33-1241(+)
MGNVFCNLRNDLFFPIHFCIGLTFQDALPAPPIKSCASTGTLVLDRNAFNSMGAGRMGQRTTVNCTSLWDRSMGALTSDFAASNNSGAFASSSPASDNPYAILEGAAMADGEDPLQLNLGSQPSDDIILKQENAIKDESAMKLPFVGEKEPLSVLAEEYENGNAVFRAKIERLAGRYDGIRRSRGDGNCFFRSFMFSYLEYILVNQDEAEAQRMLQRVEHCKQLLTNVGYQSFTWEDFVAVFLEQLESVRPGPASISGKELLERCQDSDVSNYVVMFFRFVTSVEIQSRADFFEPFIIGSTDGMTVLKFCQSHVEPMGEESDHIHITALTDALQVPVRVVYLDRSGGTEGFSDGDGPEVNHHDFFPSEASAAGGRSPQEPSVVLLYRPGHYDILYSKQKAQT